MKHEEQRVLSAPERPVPLLNRRRGRSLPAFDVKPSARELFPGLRDRMLASRPVIGHTVETFHADGTSTGGKPIYGKPTFRNVIDKNGRHI